MLRRGLLSNLFEGIGVKELAAVDADSTSSNQHEVTGSKPLLRILGDQDRKFPRGGEDNRFFATYIWLGSEQDAISEEGRLSWYDSRRADPTRSPEWRLYYQTNFVTSTMRPGNILFVAKKRDGHLLFIVTPKNNTILNQLSWLFGLDDKTAAEFSVRELTNETTGEIDFAAGFILDELGIEPDEPEISKLDELLERFGKSFPTTKEFSELARSSLAGVSKFDDADTLLMMWVEQEERLFRRLERRIVDDRLREGFVSNDTADVDGFLSFSLSVQNRRKARAGQSLENHLEALFKLRGLLFARGAETENRNKPDFLFPGQKEYRDNAFSAEKLTMLGAKSTLKDRWRQVLAEAIRIPTKHLLTLEPGISQNQTDQMAANSLQLVVPQPIHSTFLPAQRSWLVNLEEFLKLVRGRQETT